MSETDKNLDVIYSYYERIYGAGSREEAVEVSKFVSTNISYRKRTWTWRYFLSLRNGTMKPSRWAIKAIEQHAKKIIALEKKRENKEPTYTQKRNAYLDEYATKYGFPHWSAFETFIFNGGDPLKEKTR